MVLQVRRYPAARMAKADYPSILNQIDFLMDYGFSLGRARRFNEPAVLTGDAVDKRLKVANGHPVSLQRQRALQRVQ